MRDEGRVTYRYRVIVNMYTSITPPVRGEHPSAPGSVPSSVPSCSFASFQPGYIIDRPRYRLADLSLSVHKSVKSLLPCSIPTGVWGKDAGDSLCRAWHGRTTRTPKPARRLDNDLRFEHHLSLIPLLVIRLDPQLLRLSLYMPTHHVSQPISSNLRTTSYNTTSISPRSTNHD